MAIQNRSTRRTLVNTITAGIPAAFAIALFTAQASAATTVGQLDPAPGGSACAADSDWLNSTVSTGASYVVPALTGTSDERITSWSTNARANTSGTQMLTMKVFRNAGGPVTWMAVSHDGPRALNPSALNTFSGLNIAVKPGDVVGVNAATGSPDCVNTTSGTSDAILLKTAPGLGDGQTGMFISASNGYRANVTAVVKPSNAFTLGPPKRNKKNGTAEIDASLPGAGVVDVSGAGVQGAQASSVTAAGPGVVMLIVKATGKAKKKLRKTGKVLVTANVTYTPTGGDLSTQSELVKLKRKR